MEKQTVTRAMIKSVEFSLENDFGYRRYEVGHRNGGFAIDVMTPEGGCERTLRCGMTKREVFEQLHIAHDAVVEILNAKV